MDNKPTIPKRLTTLGAALQPCLTHLQQRIDEAILPTNSNIGDLVGWLQSSLNRLQNNLDGINYQFDQMTRQVTCTPFPDSASLQKHVAEEAEKIAGLYR